MESKVRFPQAAKDVCIHNKLLLASLKNASIIILDNKYEKENFLRQKGEERHYKNIIYLPQRLETSSPHRTPEL